MEKLSRKITASEIGNKIRKLRKSKNISLDIFCEDINRKYGTSFNKSTVCRWENGTQSPTINNFLLLSKYYDVDVYYLFSGLKEDNTPFLEILNKNNESNHFKKLLKEININLDELKLKDLEKIKKMISFFSEKGFEKIDAFLELIY